MISALLEQDDVDSGPGELGRHGRPARARPDDHHFAVKVQVAADLRLAGQPADSAHGRSAPAAGPASCGGLARTDLRSVGLQPPPGHGGDIGLRVVADLPLHLGQVVVAHGDHALEPLDHLGRGVMPGQQRPDVRLGGAVIQPGEPPSPGRRIHPRALVEQDQRGNHGLPGRRRQRAQHQRELAQHPSGPVIRPHLRRADHLGEPRAASRIGALSRGTAQPLPSPRHCQPPVTGQPTAPHGPAAAARCRRPLPPPAGGARWRCPLEVPAGGARWRCPSGRRCPSARRRPAVAPSLVHMRMAHSGRDLDG